jgi:hypothetical protein
MMAAAMAVVGLGGCGGGSGGVSGSGSSGEPDLVVSVRIDDTTGFLNLVDGASDTRISNANGAEVDPSVGVFAYGGCIYTTGSMANNKLAKYTVNDDNSLSKIAETTVFEGGKSVPTCLIFVDDTKAYLTLAGTGELLVIDPADLSTTKRIDLSAYAMDAEGNFGGEDLNPEPSGGVIRGGKLYLALAQIDSFSSWCCRGKASLLIIDVETNEILSHISDERTCTSGLLSPNTGLILDEHNDIYVTNAASFGYYPGFTSGFLRIKDGEDTFDPDYFFSISDMTNLDVEGGEVRYAYNDLYMSNGELYTTLFVPGLTSNPPDYANDKNYVPYVLNLWDQTATKIDGMLPTVGWSTHLVNYDGEAVFGMTTVNGTGLYYAGEDTPFLTTEGSPYIIATLE